MLTIEPWPSSRICGHDRLRSEKYVPEIVNRSGLDAGNFGGEDRHQIAIRIPPRERLIKQPRTVLVLGADREMRVEQGRRLPPQKL